MHAVGHAGIEEGSSGSSKWALKVKTCKHAAERYWTKLPSHRLLRSGDAGLARVGGGIVCMHFADRLDTLCTMRLKT